MPIPKLGKKSQEFEDAPGERKLSWKLPDHAQKQEITDLDEME